MRVILALTGLCFLFFSCGKHADPVGDNSALPDSATSRFTLTNQHGDTLPTGVPIAMEWTKVGADTVPPPGRFLRLDSVRYPDSHIRPLGNPEVIPVPDSFPTFTPGKNGLEPPRDTVIHPEKKRAIFRRPIPAGDLALRDKRKYHLPYLSRQSNLPLSSVSTVFEDSRGYLWIGISSVGVVRYDGQSFQLFSRTEGFVETDVREIMEDSKGNLWFSTAFNGAIRFDGTHFYHYPVSETVNFIHESRNGDFWLLTQESGIMRMRGDSIWHYGQKQGIPAPTFLTCHEDKDGTFWFGSYGAGVLRFDGNTFENIHIINRRAPNKSYEYVPAIYRDSKERLWFGTWGNGLTLYDGKTFTNYMEQDGLLYGLIWSITEDKYGNLWLGTREGVSRFDGKRFLNMGIQEGLSHTEIRSLSWDSKGNLWVCSNGGGAIVIRPDGFRHFSKSYDLLSNTTLSLGEDKTGGVWLGSWVGGLVRYKEGKFNLYSVDKGNEKTFWAIEPDDADGVWLATERDGIAHFFKDSLDHYSSVQGLPSNRVSSLLRDGQKRIWAGHKEGLSRIDPDGIVNFRTSEGKSLPLPVRMTMDAKGDIWFATYEGAAGHFDGDHVTFYSENEGLNLSRVRDVFIDSRERIWVCGNGGLFYWDRDKFVKLPESNDFTSSQVIRLVEDKDLRLWVGTKDGMYCLSWPEGRDQAAKVQRIDETDGLITQEVLSLLYRKGENELWVGTSGGTSMIDLDHFNFPEDAPKVYLDHIEIDGTYIGTGLPVHSSAPDIAFDSIQPFTNYPANLDLPYANNHLLFQCAAIDWSGPQHVEFQYQLEGFEENWNPATPENRIDYLNIPYGKFTFRARARGRSGEWSEPFEYSFRIRPPWYHTWWARSAYALLALLFVLGFVRWRTRRLLQRQAELEHIVDERTHEIQEQKKQVEIERDRSEELLLNILPAETAEELKKHGKTEARSYEMVSVIFTDFQDFTIVSEKMTPEELVTEIHHCYTAFDEIIHRHGIEKIKTIGDAYMAASGLPTKNPNHAKDAVKAALDIRDWMLTYQEKRAADGKIAFKIRIGVHSGPVVAGIVGIKKFAYDIWGDTVNTAARMESSSGVGKVNISGSTYDLVKDEFECEYRGKIEAKNKGKLDMYYVEAKG